MKTTPYGAAIPHQVVATVQRVNRDHVEGSKSVCGWIRELLGSQPFHWKKINIVSFVGRIMHKCG